MTIICVMHGLLFDDECDIFTHASVNKNLHVLFCYFYSVSILWSFDRSFTFEIDCPLSQLVSLVTLIMVVGATCNSFEVGIRGGVTLLLSNSSKVDLTHIKNLNQYECVGYTKVLM